MEPIFEGKKLELHYDNVGEEKARSQSLGNLKKKASNEDIIAFGQLMGELAPEEESIKSLVTVEKQRFDI